MHFNGILSNPKKFGGTLELAPRAFVGVFKNKYISVILAFVVYSIKLVTSAVGISLPSVSCI